MKVFNMASGSDYYPAADDGESDSDSVTATGSPKRQRLLTRGERSKYSGAFNIRRSSTNSGQRHGLLLQAYLKTHTLQGAMFAQNLSV